MSLKARIQDDLKAAMKAGAAAERDALRMLLSALLTAEKAEGRDLAEAEELQVAAKVVKQTRGSIDEYAKLGQADTVSKLDAELGVYERYAPAQLDDETIRNIVAVAVAESGATGPADMGKVMKLVMPQVQGRADGGAVNRIVKEALSQQ
jgi:uncharacterized protein YqeY